MLIMPCFSPQLYSVIPENAIMGSTYDTLSWVDGNVAIGGYKAASNKQLMSDFDCIVSMIPVKDTPRFAGIEYFSKPVPDNPKYNIASEAGDAAIFVRNRIAAGKRVFVHCHAGISRSATVVLIYLMARHGMPLPDALALLKNKRPQVHPNDGFMRILKCIDAQMRLKRIKDTA